MSKSTKNENKERNSKSFQTHEPITQKILHLEVKSTRKLPFNNFQPGKLEIALNSELIMTMSLTSSLCNEKQSITTNSWKGNLEFCLKYTDKEWKYQEKKIQLPMVIGTRTIIAYEPDGHDLEPQFSVNITTLKTDVKLRTSPAICKAESIYVSCRIKQVNETGPAFKLLDKVDKDNGGDGDGKGDDWGSFQDEQDQDDAFHEAIKLFRSLLGANSGLMEHPPDIRENVAYLLDVNETGPSLKLHDKVDRDHSGDWDGGGDDGGPPGGDDGGPPGGDDGGPPPDRQENVANLLDNTTMSYPTIAVIGSGGGMRAVIGMSGAMVGLQTTGILDKTVYTAGVSGSAWYLLTLYSGFNGAPNPITVNLQIENNIRMFRRVCVAWNIFKYFMIKITGRSEEFFTFTNTFGEIIGSLLLNWSIQRLHTWSTQFDEVKACLLPFPMVAALHVIDETTIKEYHEWVEITPYELCILEYGVAIETADLGKEFEYGLLNCTPQERRTREIEEHIKHLKLQLKEQPILDLLDSELRQFSNRQLEKPIFKHQHELPIHFLQGICGSAYAIVREYRLTDHRNQQHVQELQDIKWYQPWRYVRHLIGNWLGYVRDLIWKMFNLFDSLFIAKVPNFLKGMQLRKKDPPHDVIELKNNYLMLVDAGLSFNSPYPLVLHPSRKVDFIISFDWSDREQDAARPFGELIKAEKWAHDHGVPFPSIEKKIVMIEDEWDAGIVKDMYIFEEDGAPTIVHFVMIDISGKLRIHSDYGTLKFSYTANEFTDFNDLARQMVVRNAPAITDCILRHKRISRRDQQDRQIRV